MIGVREMGALLPLLDFRPRPMLLNSERTVSAVTSFKTRNLAPRSHDNDCQVIFAHRCVNDDFFVRLSAEVILEGCLDEACVALVGERRDQVWEGRDFQ